MMRAGVLDLLKDGTKHLTGIDEAVLKNLEACKNLANITRTSLGPNGMNKMVVNHLDKLFVTHDAATIMEQLEVVHPAAKMLVLASKSQQEEVGDGTNFVIVLAGELLKNAEQLIIMGIHPSEILQGYLKACKRTLELLPTLATHRLDDVRDEAAVTQALRPVLSAKVNGNEDVLAPIVAQACIQTCPPNQKFFNIDNIRVLKIEGASIGQSFLLNGLAFARDSMSSTKSVQGGARIAVFSCGIEPSSTDTKGVIQLNSAEELKSYNRTEEDAMAKVVQELADARINVVVSSGNVSDIAMHFLEMHNMIVVRLPSKFDIRRLCKSTGAIAGVRLGAPAPEEIGTCDTVRVEEIGGTRCVIFDKQDQSSRVATIVVRGATHNMMDDVERAIDDAVNVYKSLCRDPQLVPGAGATEIEIARRIKEFGMQQSGLDQYSIQKYAESFEAVPKTLAENAGMNPTNILSALYTAHKQGNAAAGVDVEEHTVGDMGGTINDSLNTKYWAIKFATDAAINVLRVDQIIMAKPAGGPKPGAEGPRDD
nr:T-complex protein 1 subunit theta [Seculamonas ecuadoriensis]